MSFRKIRLLPIAFATIAGLSSLFASDHVSLKKPGSLLTEAHAIIVITAQWWPRPWWSRRSLWLRCAPRS